MKTPLALAATAAFALCVRAPSAQQPQGDPTPLGPEQVASQFTNYTQEWGKVAMDPAGTRYVIAWESVIGHQVWMRLFLADGTPLTNEIEVNTTLTNHIQDEPMAAMDAAGNSIVCWSDRSDYDNGGGGGMGCFARAFDPFGVPLGPEFQVNGVPTDSQWEPMPAALPGGGWVVAFNGDNDGNAYLRYLDLDGTPRTGDIGINTFLNNGQTEAECAVTPDGTVLAVYADFGANVQGGTGTNLLARRFDETGAALDGLESVVNGSTLSFDQLEPRIAAHDDGFVMVWEDHGNDGSGIGIWARRYDVSGAPLGDEFRVNAVTTGHQFLPEVDCDAAGNFVVCWEDLSTGVGEIHARAFDAAGQPQSLGFIVSQGLPPTPDGYKRPQVALSDDGTLVVFSYGGPGVPATNNNHDVFFRRYAWSFSEAGPFRTSRPGRRGAAPGPSGPTAPGVSPVLK